MPPAEYRAEDVPLESISLVNRATRWEIRRTLAIRGLTMRGTSEYEFFVPNERERYHMGEAFFLEERLSFVLPLFLFEAGFHLPLHHFFHVVLWTYGVTPGQLSGMSWFCLTSFFIDCCLRGEEPQPDAFFNLYYLGWKEGSPYVHLRSREKGRNPVGDCVQGVKVARDKFVGVTARNSGPEYVEAILFPLNWCLPSSARCMPAMRDLTSQPLALAQYRRYRGGHAIHAGSTVTMRNVFVCCLGGCSPLYGVVAPDAEAWPWGDDPSMVARVLRGEIGEPPNFSSSFGSFPVREWIPLEEMRMGRTSGGWPCESASASRFSPAQVYSSDSPSVVEVSSAEDSDDDGASE